MPWGSTLKANYGNVMRAMKTFARTETSIMAGAYRAGMSGASSAGITAMNSGAGRMGIARAYGSAGARSFYAGLGGGRRGAARLAGWTGLGYGAYRGVTSPFRGDE